MSETWQNVLVVVLGTFISSLIAAGKLPSEMATIGWADSLFGPVLQAALMGLGTLGYHTALAQRALGR